MINRFHKQISKRTSHYFACKSVDLFLYKTNISCEIEVLNNVLFTKFRYVFFSDEIKYAFLQYLIKIKKDTRVRQD